uniref:Protein longifolia 1 n=1 Tax=Tanacetum cinerariifolium TaxID=118510 RepID=A0A6L2L5E4_TANCI|nr:protein longifolia 1 [Tanacetum cinerariifolium]
MMAGLIQDQNLEKQIQKQIGCMSGFLHIFDRQQILSGKRIYSHKRLPPSTVSSPVKSVQSTVSVTPTKSPVSLLSEVAVGVPENPDRFRASPVSVTPPKSPLPLPLFEIKEGGMKNSWKFCKEMPRLSLDSRAIVDSKGSLCAKPHNSPNARSPSVIARLMGLEQLPSENGKSSPTNVKEPKLRRSASESRVSKDLFHSRYIDGNGNSVQNTQQSQIKTHLNNTSAVKDNVSNNDIYAYSSKLNSQKMNDSSKTNQWRSSQQRRSFFDSTDFFPEPKQAPRSLPVYGDSGEQTNDLETLKNILEALQLKGLLHSKRPFPIRVNNSRNFVYDDSNVVFTKPWRSPAATNRIFGNNPCSSPSVSPRSRVVDRSGRSPVRSRLDNNNSRNCNTIVKKKPLSIDTQRSFNDRNSPINSPRVAPKRNGYDQSVTNRSPRNRRHPELVKVSRNFTTEDETSSFTESSGSTTSHSDPENRDGKSLLARCDKLLSSIAEMNSLAESQASLGSVLPSPVSVLDSIFDNDESSSPSPVMKRSIHFKDLNVVLEDDMWSSIISPTPPNHDDFPSNDPDFTYISQILQASKYLPDDSNLFFLLEKQQFLNGTNTSKASKLHRKLIFDTVSELLDQNEQLPPWIVTQSHNSAKQICSEFEKIREPEKADNVLDLICVVLKRDLASNNGWGNNPIETSEAVLNIERLIFKDLVCETIRDLAEFAGKSTFFAPRRKLVF